MKRTQLLLALCCMLLAACSTTPGGDAAISPQSRREFEQMKYRNPATGQIPPNMRWKELQFARRLPGSVHQLKHIEGVQNYASFQQVGPWNIGGRTRAVAMDVTDENILLAGGVSGGLWRTSNAGTDWYLVTHSHELHNITSLAQDRRPGRTHIWYYGTGEAYGNSAQISGNGIWKSTDGGHTFSVLPSTVSDRTPSLHSFAYSWRIVLPTLGSDEVVYNATARFGILRSTDGGGTWTTTLSSDSYFSDIAITDSGVLYAALSSFTAVQNTTAARKGIFRSVDGITWTDISPPDLPKEFNRAVIGTVPGADKIFVIAETPNQGTKGQFHLRTGTREEWHSLWSYEYGGGDGTGTDGTWINRSANIPLMGGRSGDFISQGGYDLLVRISPHDTNVVILGGTNLYRSTSGFRSNEDIAWIGGYGLPVEGGERFPLWPNHHPDQHDVLFHPSQPRSLISANDAGVFITSEMFADTVQWTSLNRGYFTTQHYAVSIRHDKPTHDIVGGMQDNGTWATNASESTQPWFNRGGGDGGYSCFAEKGRTLYVSSQQGRIRRLLLDENGVEVARTRIDPAGPSSDDYLFINPFAVDPNAEHCVFTPAGRIIWRNNDITSIPMGADDSVSIGWDTLHNSRIPSGRISSIAVSHSPAHILYYGTSVGKVYRMEQAHQGQPLATDVSAGLPAGGFVNALTVDRRNAQRVIATMSNYGILSIFITENGGTTWQAISGNLEEFPNGGGNGPAVNWVDIVPFDNTTDVLVAATSTGLYMTSEINGMSTVWTQIAASEIGNVPIDMVVTRHEDKRIVVGTHGRGVFAGTITALPPRPSQPTLLHPENGSMGIATEVALGWAPVQGAVSYRVELSPTSAFTDSVQQFDGITDTSFRVTGLKEGPHQYYWRVTAFGGGGKGQESEVWQFSTIVRPPTLITPANREEGVSGLPVRLAWERVPFATHYDVQVGTNLAFTTIVDSVVNISDTVAHVGNMASGTRYFWRVRSSNQHGTSSWSTRHQFITGVLTGVSESDWNTAKALNVAPNPTSDRIVVTNPRGLSSVQLWIVDASGKTIQQHSVEATKIIIDTRHLPPGVYSLRMLTEGEAYKSQFVVVR